MNFGSFFFFLFVLIFVRCFNHGKQIVQFAILWRNWLFKKYDTSLINVETVIDFNATLSLSPKQRVSESYFLWAKLYFSTKFSWNQLNVHVHCSTSDNSSINCKLRKFIGQKYSPKKCDEKKYLDAIASVQMALSVMSNVKWCKNLINFIRCDSKGFSNDRWMDFIILIQSWNLIKSLNLIQLLIFLNLGILSNLWLLSNLGILSNLWILLNLWILSNLKILSNLRIFCFVTSRERERERPDKYPLELEANNLTRWVPSRSK